MRDDELTPAQRDALAALKATRGPCPPAEALMEYEALSADDRARRPEHAHVTTCSRCQLVLLHTSEGSKGSKGSTGSIGSNGSGVLKWALPMAAVALLAIGFTLVDRRGGSLDPPAGDTIRGTEIQPMTPAGSVDRVSEFSWQSPARFERYRLVVYRVGGTVIWQSETTATRVTPPNDLDFPMMVELRWMVEGLDREGSVRMTSPLQSFVYAPRVYAPRDR